MKKCSSNKSILKIRFKNTIIVFTILPVTLISFALYFIISNYQWSDYYNKVSKAIEKTYESVNTKLNNAVEISNNIITNPFLIKLISTDYGNNLEERINANKLLSMYFTNYKDSVTAENDEFKIFHNNKSIFQDNYSAYLSDLENSITDTVANLGYNEVYWLISDTDNILYRKFITSKNEQLIILKYNVCLSKDDLNIDAPLLLNDNDISAVITAKPINNTKNKLIFSKELINNCHFTAMIPKRYQTHIYTTNFICLALILSLFVFTVIFLSSLVSRNITQNIYSFIAKISNYNILTSFENFFINENDELSPVYIKIKEMITTINKFHMENNKIKDENTALELKFIQSQINPHLLYNSLSVLRWDCLKYDEKLADNIDKLVEYYRSTISDTKNIIKFEQEIKMTKNYISVIEFIRMTKINYIIDFSEEVLNLNTIKYILQPFVENSAIHGIQNIDNSLIKISGHIIDNKLVLKVEDNGVGISDSQLEKIKDFNYDSLYKNHGMNNTIKRVMLYYGDCDFNIESKLKKGTIITIIIDNYNLN